MLLKRIFGSEREKERWMSESLENRSKVFKIYSVIRTKIPQSILLAVGFSDNVSTKTIVHLNDEKGACFSDANSICFFPGRYRRNSKSGCWNFTEKPVWDLVLTTSWNAVMTSYF